MPAVDFVTTDPEAIETEIFHLYEQTTGRALAQGYEILAEVQTGEREMPTEDELLELLPELVISYS